MRRQWRREECAMWVALCRIVMSMIIGVAFATAAAAQDRIFHDGWELGALGHFGQRLGPAAGLDGRLVAGGRVAVTDTEAVDLPTGARRALPPGATVVALDPARPRVVLAMPGTGPAGTFDLALFELVPGTSETIVTGVCRSPIAGGAATVSAYAYDAQLVIAQRCAAGGAAQDIVAVDASQAPARLRVLWSATTFASQLEVSSDGQRFFIRTALGFGTARTHGFDVATGAALGTIEKGGDMRWDDALDALLVTTEGYLDAEVVVVSRTMAILAAAPFSERICSVRAQVSPHTGRVYVATDGGTNTFARPLQLEAFAGTPLQRVAAAFPAPTPTPCAPLVLHTAPGAPRALTATVTAGTVALDWTNVGGASSFVLEVGVAPGRTHLSVFSGPDSQSSFALVPSGTYYLRVRGANAFGSGRPSSEVRVVVP